MYQSYFKIGWRNLLKNKGYSFINIGGLAVGMSVAMLIGLWIYDEISYDKYHGNYDRIGRVIRNGTVNGETFSTTYLPYALGDELKSKYGSNFKHVIMAWPLGDHILSIGDRKISHAGQFIEAGAPEMLSLKMIKGSRGGLKDPRSILLSASLAKILFGEEDPMEKAMKIDNAMDVKVTGVYEDLPHNTQFRGTTFFAPWDLFVSYNQWMLNQGFKNNFLDIYVEVQPGTDFEKASASIKNAIFNNVKDDQDYVEVNPQLFLHPMSKWHLRSEFKNGKAESGLIQFVWLFGIIGAFVLLLACINFMNLSTARSERRAKEVGIRKVMGSVRTQLVKQFFSESFLVVSLAFIISILFVSISLSCFNTLAGKEMSMFWTSPYFWSISLAFIIITGLLAGSYP
ncbi:MAG: ABC transporter permease, partial [Marivirga sp.]|nr:ABC transporter permease [Marivirga sp.]